MILYLIIAFLFGLILIIPKIKNKYLLAIVLSSPLIHSIADSTTNYFEGEISTGLIRGVLLLVVLLLLSGHLKFKGITFWIYIFLFYTAFLIPTSSNILAALNEYVKVFISMMMFPIGYYLINDLNKLNKIISYIYLGALIIILQLIIAQIFSLGDSVYLEDSFYLGGGIVQVTYTLVLVVLISPISFLQKNNKQTDVVKYLIILSSILITLIALRRISIAALVGGYIVFLLYSGHKKYLLKYSLIGVLFLVALYPFYGAELDRRIDARNMGERQITEESRFGETIAVYEEIMYGDIEHILFGSDLYNSGEYFANHPSYYFIFGGGRQLHVDYNIILHGAGIIGFFFYLIVHLKILLKIYKTKADTSNRLSKEFKAILYSLFFILVFIPLSGSISGVGFRSTLFLLLGSMISILTYSNNHLNLKT